MAIPRSQPARAAAPGEGVDLLNALVFRGALTRDQADRVRRSARANGVAEERIYAAGLCTAMHLHVLTSYRAEKEKAGRIAGAIRAARWPRP